MTRSWGLKEKLNSGELIRILEASNGLSGLVVESTIVDGREFDGMWLSSFCDSMLRGRLDDESVTFEERLETVKEIVAVTKKPLIVDGDSGGSISQFSERVKVLEKAGAAGIIIEDKTGAKHNSITCDECKHTLIDREEFALKLRAGISARETCDFLIIARIESFIAGSGIEDALLRADKYVSAGADAIMIHSKKKSVEEIKEFLNAFRKVHKDVPVVLVPTSYNSYSEEELKEFGANVLIYANQLLRSAFLAMTEAARSILINGKADESILNMASMQEINNLVVSRESMTDD